MSGCASDKLARIQVLSCFNGLAMYAAAAYFEPRCRYSDGERDGAYADNPLSTGRIVAPSRLECEHVTLHRCLARVLGADRYRAAVAPWAVAYYHKPHDGRKREGSEGKR